MAPKAKDGCVFALGVLPSSLLMVLFLTGCNGPQSTLQPAGIGAERIAALFWWMFAGALAIWLVVMGIALYAMHIKKVSHSPRQARWLIIGGGAALPTVVLFALLAWGLLLLPSLREPREPGLQIAVSGEQWWWRVKYVLESGETVELANEIRLPVGERVEFTLTSPDVIHSFWIPSLGGKVDMIPGRTTRLVLEPSKTGVYRGVCAEYCGSSHALMNFQVVVTGPQQFGRWLEQQAKPAVSPDTPMEKRGQKAFLSNGCGACHSVRGTDAKGAIGPDLTHVGSRLGLGADVLTNDKEAFTHWIRHTDQIKPDVKMPSFEMLPRKEVAELAAYLDGLK